MTFHINKKRVQKQLDLCHFVHTAVRHTSDDSSIPFYYWLLWRQSIIFWSLYFPGFLLINGHNIKTNE